MRRKFSVASQTTNASGLNYVYIRAIQESFKQFSKNSSLCGYRYLTEGTTFERCTWLVIHITALATVIYLNIYMWNMFITDPTIVTLEKFTLPIREVPFPGISVCNINRISKNAAFEMAIQYFRNSGGKVDKLTNITSIMERIRFLGKLYDFSYSDQEQDELMHFQRFLEEFDPYRSSQSPDYDTFDVLGKMKKLTGDCLSMLSECFWDGESRNCAELFVNDLTMDGFCCIFNHYDKNIPQVSKTIRRENNNETLSSKKFGKDFGLSFRITINHSDYYYTPMATMGTKILFTSAEDFADTTSGSLVEKLVPIGVEANLELTAQSIYTVKEASKYSIEKSDCIMDCKIRSVAALCECVSFMHNNAAISAKTKLGSQCTLTDLACLSKYAAKWRQIYPRGYKGEGLEREKQDALNCQQCYPECDTSRYFVNSEQGIISSKEEVNYSIVNIYFETPYVEQHKQDVVYYWFDMISMFGGICSLVMGISLISCVEVIFFFTYKVVENSYRLSH